MNSKRYMRPDKRVCAYEPNNLSRLQNALSSGREKAVTAAKN